VYGQKLSYTIKVMKRYTVAMKGKLMEMIEMAVTVVLLAMVGMVLITTVLKVILMILRVLVDKALMMEEAKQEILVEKMVLAGTMSRAKAMRQTTTAKVGTMVGVIKEETARRMTVRERNNTEEKEQEYDGQF
jgi:hypothetical protein